MWLGETSDRNAERVRDKIEELVKFRRLNQTMTLEVAAWVAKLPDELANRLAELNLIDPPNNVAMPTLVEFVDRYIAKRTDTKPATLIVYKRCRTLLSAYFKTTRLDKVTVADAKDFTRSMKTEKKPLAENTARRMNGFVRQFINDAVDAELLTKNPFKSKDIKVAVRGDANGFQFLSLTDTAKLIDACPVHSGG